MKKRAESFLNREIDFMKCEYQIPEISTNWIENKKRIDWIYGSRDR